ncbi:copper homeostasis protein CutC [Sanguibacter massiliensis]|uniref:copper homeostasis protein CutC n=1 Tax=Sanguibacter massiliensis TaxID=1973217 RepID=UPI000C81C927|nr:copper homeostasis protein CutC [Sanguibacter massiliensis]
MDSAGGRSTVAVEIAVQDAAGARVAREAGADRVELCGALDARGDVDRDAVARLRDAADGRDVTFHLALDVVPDRLAALRTLADLGVRRVLISGGAGAAYLVTDPERVRAVVRAAHT